MNRKMKIYTSYFGKAKKMKMANIEAICISRYPPKFFFGQSLSMLAPTGAMLRMTDEQYNAEFDRILARLDPQQVYDKIKTLSGGRDVALCCFEKAGDFCHRHIVAEWLNRHLDLGIEEFDYVAGKKSEATQGNLF